eukprot:216489-Pelagomonas_calceolata.AAC.1
MSGRTACGGAWPLLGTRRTGALPAEGCSQQLVSGAAQRHMRGNKWLVHACKGVIAANGQWPLHILHGLTSSLDRHMACRGMLAAHMISGAAQKQMRGNKMVGTCVQRDACSTYDQWCCSKAFGAKATDDQNL